MKLGINAGKTASLMEEAQRLAEEILILPLEKKFRYELKEIILPEEELFPGKEYYDFRNKPFKQIHFLNEFKSLYSDAMRLFSTINPLIIIGEKRTPDQIAADVRKDLARGSRAYIEIRDAQGRTPLMLAVDLGYAPVVKVLLDAGARVMAKGDEGKTLLDRARALGCSAIVGLLEQQVNDDLRAIESVCMQGIPVEQARPPQGKWAVKGARP